MPATPAKSLTSYEKDIYAWSQEQAALLRDMAARRVNTPLDLENLAEEIDALGRSELRACETLTVRILEHLLKLAFSPAAAPRVGWMRSAAAARGGLRRRLTRSIEREIRADLAEHYEDARRLADLALREHREDEAALRLPLQCPFTFEQIVEQDWYPSLGEARDAPAPPRTGA